MRPATTSDKGVVKITDTIKLTDEQLDALREVGNIGAAHASAALEQLIGKNIYISVPSAAHPLSLEYIPRALGKKDDIIVLLFFKIMGDAEGNILIVFSEEQARSISNILLGRDVGQEMDEDNESALKEVGNILTSTYLTALSTLVGFSLVPSIPYIAHDTVSNVADTILIDLRETSDYALVTDTEFLLDKKTMAGKCLTLFGRDSFISILKALGVYKK
ncbi:MAG: chemotaxis protein CheC [Candidatus Hydrothermarchaeaceae archaeon]